MTKNKKSKQQNSANQMWGGRFENAPSEVMRAINVSIGFDQKLYKQDIQGSIAHSTMLCEVGILKREEAKNYRAAAATKPHTDDDATRDENSREPPQRHLFCFRRHRVDCHGSVV